MTILLKLFLTNGKNMHEILKKSMCILLLVVIVWSCIFITDFLRAILLKKPIFVVPLYTADDGGSGRYLGLGYWFDIKGNFLPESENKGVTSIKGTLLGLCIVDKQR